MLRVWQVVKWGGVPVGVILSGLSAYFNAVGVMAWGLPVWLWYLIGLIILSASFIFIIFGFWRQNKALKEAIGVVDNSNIKLMEWRQEYRKPQSSKVANIPPTLGEIWKLVHNIMEGKKKRHISKDKLLEMVIKLVQVPSDDPILNADNYTTEQKIKKISKRLGLKMGFRKPNAKLEAEWRKRIAEEMDSCGIGLQLDKSHDYRILKKQVNEDRIPITKTKVDHAIDSFMDNLYTLYSVRLLLFYGGTNKKLYTFPHEIRDVLKNIEEGVDRAMRGFLRYVNSTLEEYSIGKELDEK